MSGRQKYCSVSRRALVLSGQDYKVNPNTIKFKWNSNRNPLSALHGLHYFLWTSTPFLADDTERNGDNSCIEWSVCICVIIHRSAGK